MATLTVKNVGPIREAELEVKKHTVFIGPQGTGKSTLAKLIAIGGDTRTFPGNVADVLLGKYGLDSFTSTNSQFNYHNTSYDILFEKERENITPKINGDENLMYDVIARRYRDAEEQLSKGLVKQRSVFDEKQNILKNWEESKASFVSLLNKILTNPSSYIPAERTLISLLSYNIWGIISSGTDLPDMVTQFGYSFEKSRNHMKRLEIPYLEIFYSLEGGEDYVYNDESGHAVLSRSASGYQSIIPLLLVVEHQRQESQRRFIIEEPELNLYPTAQKDLIYSLMSGLQPDVEYKDAEWVITTHSPYVLSSFNTLMLAYKVAQRSDELRAEVEKIIPARCWINPDEFAAYYVDKGIVRSIISEKTGMIADNELDDVSDDLADEQNKLFALSRSVLRD